VADKRESPERSSPAILPALIISLVLVLVVGVVCKWVKARLENKPGGAADGANGAMMLNAMFAPASRDDHADNGTQPSTQRTRLAPQAAPRPPSDEVVNYAYDVPAVRPVGAQTDAPTYDANGVALPPMMAAGAHDDDGGGDDECEGFGSNGYAVAANEPALYLLPVPLISQAIRGRGSIAATCYATPDYGAGGHLPCSEAVGKDLAFATYSTIDSAPGGGAQQLDGGRSGQLAPAPAQAGGGGGYASVQLANVKPTPGWGFGAAAAEDGNAYASIQLRPPSHTSENAYFASDY
jgi:hypothetical protein